MKTKWGLYSNRRTDCRCDVCSGGDTEQRLIALSPSPHDHSFYWHGRRPAHLNCEHADWRLWCMLAENRASFINECQISILVVPLSVHTSVIPASVCLTYQLDHHVVCRRRDAFWCLLCLAVTDERLYVGGRSSCWSTIPRVTVGCAKACMCQTVTAGGMPHCCCRLS